MKTSSFYTLRQVSDLTGLSEFTLRGWEGRYSAFRPRRTETGRRKYSSQDLQKAFLLRELTSMGYRIGDIADLSNSSLEQKLDGLVLNNEDKKINQSVDVESIMKFVLLQDWQQLKKYFRNCIQKNDPILVVEEVILPILSQLNSYIADLRIGIAQEHILSSLIKEQLYILISKTTETEKSKSDISFVIATPEGDYHELGLLVAHVILNASGVQSLYLGPNTPKNELCETAIRFGASHILIASTVNKKEGAREDVYAYLHYLDKHLPQHIQIWSGGRSFDKLNINLNRNFNIIKSLYELSQKTQKLRLEKKKVK